MYCFKNVCIDFFVSFCVCVCCIHLAAQRMRFVYVQILKQTLLSSWCACGMHAMKWKYLPFAEYFQCFVVVVVVMYVAMLPNILFCVPYTLYRIISALYIHKMRVRGCEMRVRESLHKCGLFYSISFIHTVLRGSWFSPFHRLCSFICYYCQICVCILFHIVFFSSFQLLYVTIRLRNEHTLTRSRARVRTYSIFIFLCAFLYALIQSLEVNKMKRVLQANVN